MSYNDDTNEEEVLEEGGDFEGEEEIETEEDEDEDESDGSGSEEKDWE